MVDNVFFTSLWVVLRLLFATSYLDFLSFLFASLPASILRPLHFVQNYTACLLHRCDKSTHKTLISPHLQWLPLISQTQFNILLITHKTLNCPSLYKPIQFYYAFLAQAFSSLSFSPSIFFILSLTLRA